MRYQLLPGPVEPYRPDAAIELRALVDGRALRVELDKAAVLHLMKVNTLTQDVIDACLARFHTLIDITIQARLYALGVPLDRHVVLSIGDFPAEHPA